ncbi:MAG: methyl-accepting chemotaxis protein [Desulfosarcinaceae bacterium]|nr:methyl-accepting chemotaxis protein [Desulfosarcinaceae bacterium]
MRIYQKILIAALSSLFILGLITVTASIRVLQQRGAEEIANERSLMLAEKTERLKNIVEVAMSNLESVNQRSAMSLDERQQLAKDLIRTMRYNTSDYLWINDMQAVIVMHPIKPQLDGKDLSNFKDPNGKKLFSAFVDVCARQGEGTVDYLWPKPGHEEPVAKLSYVKRFKPWDWVVGTGIYLDDIEAAVAVKEARLANIIQRQRNTLIGIGLAIYVIAGLALTWVARRIVTPIKQTNAMLKDIAEGQGDLTQRLKVASKDEVGELAHWFNAFMDKLQEVIRKVTENASALTTAATALSQLSTKMRDDAHDSSERTRTAADATAEMDTHMQQVATAMEEVAGNIAAVETVTTDMQETIAAIIEHSERGDAVTAKAVAQAETASQRVSELGAAAEEIDKVTETITEISEQTNLLALNATIEAARAGDAGKGFAVVANEIKELAKQTAEATQEIKAKISGVKASTEGTVKEIVDITEIINETSTIVSTITSRVEAQSQMTSDIAGNVGRTTQTVAEVSDQTKRTSDVAAGIAQDVSAVAAASGEMQQSSSHVNANAVDLAELAKTLDHLVGRFKVAASATPSESESQPHQ